MMSESVGPLLATSDGADTGGSVDQGRLIVSSGSCGTPLIDTNLEANELVHLRPAFEKKLVRIGRSTVEEEPK